MSQRRRVMALAIALMLLFSSTALADKTGGYPGPSSLTEAELAENERIEQQNLREVANYIAKHSDVRPQYALIPTPIIAQGLVHSVDTWYNNPPTPYVLPDGTELLQWGGGNNYTTLPVDGRRRSCAHCGVAATLSVLKWLGDSRVGRANISDISSSTGQAIFDLGAGWMNGSYNTSYAIQTCCDDADFPTSKYYNDYDRIAKNLNARILTSKRYARAEKSDYDVDTFRNVVATNMNNYYPLIVGVNGSQLPYYKPEQTKNLYHIVVLDGWDPYQDVYQINDPNDCSAVAKAKNILGRHLVNTTEFFDAMTTYFVW